MAANTKSFFGKRGIRSRSKFPATPINWSGSSSSTTPNSTPRCRATRLLGDSGNQTPSRYDDRNRRSSRSCTDEEVELYRPGMLLQEFPTVASGTRLSRDPESEISEGSPAPGEMLRDQEFDFELVSTPIGSSHSSASSHAQQPAVQFSPPADRYAQQPAVQFSPPADRYAQQPAVQFSPPADRYAENDGARAQDTSEIPSDTRTLLQQQQTVLLKILHNQAEMEAKQTEFATKLTELEKQLKQQTTSLKASSEERNKCGGLGKRKRVVTGNLTKRVSLAHSNIENQFKPEESSVSPYNLRVRETLMQEITNLPNCDFDEQTVKTAVKRCYEGLRRSYMENQEQKLEQAQDQAKKRKYRSRRQRVFDRRSTVAKPTEKEKWDSLSYMYMSEESDDPEDPETIIVHQLPWRSRTLDRYIGVLDERLKQSVARDSTGVCHAKKARKIGAPSNSNPPSNFPAWAVAVAEGPLDNITNTDSQ